MNTSKQNKLKQLVIAILATQGVAFTATAANVPISPIITGASGGYSEDEGNLWFSVDNTCSMYFWTEYDDEITYELPVGVDGKAMPMPSSNRYTKIDPFLKRTEKAKCDFWKAPHAIASSTDEDAWFNASQDDNQRSLFAGRRMFGGNDKVCGSSIYGKSYPDSDNCRIWLKYYSDRMRMLKSAISLALFTPEGKKLLSKLRVGYESYSESLNNPSSNNWKVKPMYDVDGLIGSQKQQALHQGFFALVPDSGRTALKAPVSLLDKIQKKSKTNEAGNPFLVNPTKKYAEGSNEKRMCRRNSLLMLTDGQWEILYDSDSNDNLSTNYPGIAKVRVTNSYNLPDGKSYTGLLAPYNNARSRNSKNLPTTLPVNESQNNFQVMADIALAAWKTDLDGDSSTNKLQPKWYKDSNNQIPKLDTAGGNDLNKQYWHPFNDPATWQHINTYTMGFNIKIGQCADTQQSWCDSGNAGGEVDWSEVPGEEVIPTLAKPQDLTVGTNYLSDNYRWTFNLENFNYLGGTVSRILNVSKDLANAAMVGRGRYYQVEKPSELVEGFQDLLNQGGKTVTIPAKTGSSGVAGNSQNAGNSYFSTRYDATVFNGELMKYKLFTKDSDVITCFGTTPDPLPVAGTTCKYPEWNVGKQLATQWQNRNLITAKLDGTVQEIVEFDADNLSDTQKATLKANFPPVLANHFDDDEERYQKLFNYIKGDSEEEISGLFRNRQHYTFIDQSKGRNIFGAVVRSSPVFAGLPTAYTAHLNKSETAYQKYIKTLEDYKANNTGGNAEIIYVGANDGMLHAIKANNGTEAFAYLPNAVYKNLPKTVEPDQQVSLNDGNIDLQLVNFGTNETNDNDNDDWQRILVGSMGGGAKGLYALNVTTPTATAVKNATMGNWEYSTDDDMGNIMAKPAIIQLQDNTWVALVGNGYNSKNNKAVLFVINLANGNLIQKLEMPTGFAVDGPAGNANGLGPLYFASYPNKAVNRRNYYDRAYAGDLQGNLWVFDLSQASGNGNLQVINDKPLFTATTTQEGKTLRQAITVAPKVVKHPLGYGNLVHFGTGALFDRDDLSSQVPNSIYAIWDDWIASDKGGLPEINTNTDTVKATALNVVKLKEKKITVGGKAVLIRYLNSSNLKTNWKIPNKGGAHRGWKVDLLTDNGYERAWQPAQAAYGSGHSEVIRYNTVRYVKQLSTSDCIDDGTGVESWQLVFNPEDFALNLAAQGALDLNKDGKYDADDVTTADGKPLITEDGKMVTPTAAATAGNINYNSSDQDIDDGSATQNGCRLNRQTQSNASSGTTGVTVERCAYFSSWKELK